MRLYSLSLRNFRQHADSRVQFSDGLTGIIGANGAGKTTLLEAIAWALYGNSAARGTRDSIRHARATDQAPVRVSLEFELGGHRYRVDRTLRSADVFLDGAMEPVARTIRGANEFLQRVLGMSRSEFFNTYFTGQKELDIMAALGPVERGRFLARVLGYDRLSSAQEMLREQRRAVVAELTGLRSAMPDMDVISANEQEADALLVVTRERTAQARLAHQVAATMLSETEPAWLKAERTRERWHLLEADRRVLEQDAASQHRDAERLRAELAQIAKARTELEPLLPDVHARGAVQSRVDALDALAAAESERRGVTERLLTLREEQARLQERLQKLDSAPELEREQRDNLARVRDGLAELNAEHDNARTVWTRDRQEAETRLAALRTQHDELSTQRAALEGLGAESPCPTCGRRLGESFREVLSLVTEQLETVTVDGSYFRQRVKQLEKMPEALVALEAQRGALQADATSAERRYARIQAALQEREQLSPQRAALDERINESATRLDALPQGYDASEHGAVRAELKRLLSIASRAATLEAVVAHESVLQRQLELAHSACTQLEILLSELKGEQQLLGFDASAYESLRETFAAATRAHRQAELETSEAGAASRRAEEMRDTAQRARSELTKLQTRASAMEVERSLHDELDDAFGALRDELNDQLRPELSELASAFLESLTDGRYSALELDDQYAVQVLEDGLPKSVLSGGEEDLCNLVLRLAISQMIAERAGQPFSLLILDEVFGSLDESRRDNVLALLRRLHDRFEQVIVITHIEDVREGLDRVLRVSYDQERGSSVVTASMGGAVGAGAAAWEAEQT